MKKPIALLLGTLLLCAAAHARPDHPAEHQLVTVRVTYQAWNEYRPWQKTKPGVRTFPGIVVSNHRHHGDISKQVALNLEKGAPAVFLFSVRDQISCVEEKVGALLCDRIYHIGMSLVVGPGVSEYHNAKGLLGRWRGTK